MIRRAGLMLLALLAAPLPAAADPAAAAREAAAQLEAASVQLQEADSSRDRVKALTGTVQAFEAGLAAMRDGLRRVARREAQLSAQLAARQEEVSGLLGIIQTIETSPPPVLMVHPSGPLGAARSAMMLASRSRTIASAPRLAALARKRSSRTGTKRTERHIRRCLPRARSTHRA